MSAIKELFKPSAAKLAEHVAELEGELARLTAAQDQAEAAAVAASADPAAYTKAAAEADRIKGEIATQTARLGRLKRAYTETAAREQAEYVRELEAALEGVLAEHPRTREEICRARENEKERHDGLMRGFDRRIFDLDFEIKTARQVLAFAKAGVDRATMERLTDLRSKIHHLHQKHGEDTELRAMQAATAVASTECCLATITGGRDPSTTKRIRAELEEARKRCSDLEKRRAAKEAELAPLQVELGEIESRLPSIHAPLSV